MIYTCILNPGKKASATRLVTIRNTALATRPGVDPYLMILELNRRLLPSRTDLDRLAGQGAQETVLRQVA